MSSLHGSGAVRSGLGNLKRTWSGNSQNLGEPKTGQALSQEVFFDWSDSPSPPGTPKTKPKGKENAQPDTKRRKSDEAGSAAAKPVSAQRGSFVSASSMVPSKTYSVTSTSSNSNSLSAEFSRARNPASAALLSQSSSRANTFESSTERTQSSSSSSSWMKSVSYLKEERRNGPPSTLDAPIFGRQKAVNKLFLSAEQRHVLKMVVEEKKNVFFTGSAGTGKSVLLREIIKELRQKYDKKQDAVAVTASTGIAACNIGGVTLHSFSGIGLGKESASQLISKVRKNRKALARWLRTQVLIIDEVSMIDPELFDKLEEVARVLRKKPQPFGGLQVVVTGDFFQLPPVNPGGGMTFAFEAKSWDTVMAHKVNLTQVFRQKDSSFVTMLNEMRFGQLSANTIQRFKGLERTPAYDEDIVPTELFPRREEVDRSNIARLAALNTKAETYIAQDGGSLERDAREKVLQNFLALKTLQLKVGAQVMLVKNMDETLVNGSIGKVIDFMDESDYTKQIVGQPDREQEKMSKVQQQRPTSRKWPLVRFRLPSGNHRDWLAKPESWKNELPNGEVQASRTQVPLILAWAMSIHKSQGQTLPCCKINLNRVFEKGQAYVALSRATSLDGLQVLGFNPAKVMAHPKVISWSRSLLALQQ